MTLWLPSTVLCCFIKGLETLPPRLLELFVVFLGIVQIYMAINRLTLNWYTEMCTRDENAENEGGKYCFKVKWQSELHYAYFGVVLAR